MNKTTFKRLFYRLRHDYLTLNNMVVGVAFLIALSWVWGSIEAMQKNYSLQQALDDKKRQVQLEELRVALLEFESKYYQSSEYKDLAVRQRLGHGTPGEKQLIVPSTDRPAATKTDTSAATLKSDSNFQQWLTFLFGQQK